MDVLERIAAGLPCSVEELEADGDLKMIYDAQAEKAGALANILKIHSLAHRHSPLTWPSMKLRCMLRVICPECGGK